MNRKLTALTPSLLCSILATAFASAATSDLYAQETATSKPSIATGEQPTKPSVVTTVALIETVDLHVCGSMFMMFGAPGEPPKLGEREHYVLKLLSDGKLEVSTAAKDVGHLRAVIHPPALMRMFEAKIAANWNVIAGSAITGMGQMGMRTQDAARVMKSIRAFPDQIAALKIKVSADPSTALKGLRASLVIEPIVNSWLAKLVKRLRPNSVGAPAFLGEGILKIRGAFDTEGLATMFDPMLDLLSGLGAKNKKQRTANRTLYDQFIGAQDGSFCLYGDPWGGGLNSIAGVADSGKMTAILHGSDYSRLVESTGRMTNLIETTYEPAAFVHRDVKVAKTTINLSIDTPNMSSGDQISYTAVAGNYAVTTQRMSDTDAKELIDAALDQKVKRSPLPRNSLLVLDVKLMETLDKILPFGNPLADDPESAPAKMSAVLDSIGGSLNLRVAFN